MIDQSITNSPPPRHLRGTLLIVDDEDGPRESLRAIFKDDYELLLAGDGPRAIELVQKHKVDVAVLDIRMAGMSGVDVLERIKYIDSSIEAVMMTAFETTETIRKALRLRACDYLNKPFDVADMRAAVASAMQRRSFDTEIHTNTEKLQALLKELYCNCYGYLHGHASGGTNPALLRAMGDGACVLAADTVFNREVLGDTGLFWPLEAAQLAELLRAIDADPARAERMRALPQPRIRAEYNWEKITGQYESLFLEVTGRVPPSAAA